MNKEFRDCTRVMIDDTETSKILFDSLKNVVPMCCEGAVLWDMNERFRFLKYNEQNKF